MDDLHKRTPARKAEIVFLKRSRRRKSFAAQLAYQDRRRVLPRIKEIRASAEIDPIHDRAWWIEESARDGTGWAGVIDAALNTMVAAGIIERLAAEPVRLWDARSWRQAAVEYRHDRPGRLAVEIEPKRLALLHRLMADDVSLERAWHEFRNSHQFSKANSRKRISR